MDTGAKINSYSQKIKLKISNSILINQWLNKQIINGKNRQIFIPEQFHMIKLEGTMGIESHQWNAAVTDATGKIINNC